MLCEEFGISRKTGYKESRQILAFIGRQGGRAPACGYVLARGGLFSLGVEEGRLRRWGAALAAGVERPVTGRGALQLEAQVHLIGAGARPLMTTGALASNEGRGRSDSVAMVSRVGGPEVRRGSRMNYTPPVSSLRRRSWMQSQIPR